jgi:hypothetical protein
MRVISKIFIGIAVMGLLTLASVIPASTAFAASNSLGVNPRRDYTIKPGEKVSDTLSVSNLSKTDDLVISIEVFDFGPKDESGSPAIMLERKEPTPWSLKPFLTISNELTVPAGKTVTVPFTISIPANQGAGSYYGVVKYSTAGESSRDNVTLTSSSATLVFIRVPGEAESNLTLKQFGAFTPTKSGESGNFGYFYLGKSPKYLAYRLTNNGNVAEIPTGSVELKNMFGRQVKIFDKANPNNNTVLIDQTRRFDLCINSQLVSRKNADTGQEVEEQRCNEAGLAPGRYSAHISLLYGDTSGTQHEIRGNATFWYLPIWFIALIVVGLVAVAAIIWWVIRKLRQRRGGHTHRS